MILHWLGLFWLGSFHRLLIKFLIKLLMSFLWQRLCLRGRCYTVNCFTYLLVSLLLSYTLFLSLLLFLPLGVFLFLGRHLADDEAQLSTQLSLQLTQLSSSILYVSRSHVLFVPLLCRAATWKLQLSLLNPQINLSLIISWKYLVALLHLVRALRVSFILVVLTVLSILAGLRSLG